MERIEWDEKCGILYAGANGLIAMQGHGWANWVHGVLSADIDMACNRTAVLQEAIDYLQRKVPIPLPGRRNLPVGGSLCREAAEEI
jgi:hypothetical protein